MPEPRLKLTVTREQTRVLLTSLDIYEDEYQGTRVYNEEEQALVKELRTALQALIRRFLG